MVEAASSSYSLLPAGEPPCSGPSLAAAVLLATARQAASSAFGLAGLRPHQEEVLSELFHGRDCLAVLPTGSGKSLCYALPALVRGGLVLVVSPLVALMRDQVRRFEAAGVACAALDGLQSGGEKAAVWQRLSTGALRLLLVSPERLARPGFRLRLERQMVQLVAIDEAHCISQWGGHFRPAYRHLGSYLEAFPGVQRLALTATATREARGAITNTLRLRCPALVWGEVTRSNLCLAVVKASGEEGRYSTLLRLVHREQGAGIVYVPTRRLAREVQRMLWAEGVSAAVYHAGLAAGARQEAQDAFIGGSVRVVVATNAFGLGIDKADIRFVHHTCLPASLEEYVQETGRAGRDGLEARCTLIYCAGDEAARRLMLARSYPDPALLAAVLTSARLVLTGTCGASLPVLLSQLDARLPFLPDEVGAALDLLCREGLLRRLTRYEPASWEVQEVLITDGCHPDEVLILRDYPLRKSASMAKLEAVNAYAASRASQRLAFLGEYFRR